MTRLATCLLLAPVSVTCMMAQTVFTRTLGEQKGQTGMGVGATVAGFVVAAQVFDQPAMHHRPAVLQCDQQGEPAPGSTLVVEGRVFVHGMTDGDEDVRFICGSVFPAGTVHHNGFLMKLTIGSGTIWTAQPDRAGDQHYLAVAALPDGGAVACGTTTNADMVRPLLVRFDANGNVLWEKEVLGEPGGIARDVAVDASGIVITGRRMNPSGTSDLLLMRFDLEGEPQWTRTVGGSADEEGHGLVRANDGTFIAAGYTDSHGPLFDGTERRRCVYLVKVQPTTGDTLWTRVSGDTVRHRTAFSISSAPDNDLLVAGMRRQVPGAANALVQRFTADGTFEWERNYTAGKSDRLLDILALPDGGFVATGGSFGVDGHQVLLIRRDHLGE